MNGNGASRLAIIAVIGAIVLCATGAVLFVSGGEATQRLGILFALFGVTVPSLVGLLKSDAAAQSTDSTSSIAKALNGGFEARIRHANRQTRDEDPTTSATERHAARDAETVAALASDPPRPVPAAPVQ